ncbi:hypothetical protein PV797_19630 [Clostridiaceae bacterium M8S5]|nr:hypothetical protein PV797_19630 [Clostridiaceae bacterium M8S5]
MKKKVIILIAIILFFLVGYFLNKQTIVENLNLVENFVDNDTVKSIDSITYGQEIPNTIRNEYIGFDNYYKHFFKASISFTGDTPFTYIFEQTIEKTSARKHVVSSKASAQGGHNFIASIVTHLSEYSPSETAIIYQGQSPGISFNKNGEYEINWYMKAEKYYIYSDWEAWTTDEPNTKKIVKRLVGTVSEPTPFFHIEVTKVK